jgi:hypothetical protein
MVFDGFRTFFGSADPEIAVIGNQTGGGARDSIQRRQQIGDGTPGGCPNVSNFRNGRRPCHIQCVVHK